MSDRDIGLLGLAVGVIGIGLAVAVLMPGAIRWWHRRRPLRIEIGRSARRDDALFVTVTTVGDEHLILAWASAKANDGGDYTLGSSTPDIYGLKVAPNSDGATFLLEREAMPTAGVTWLALAIFDATGHRVVGRIPARYANVLRRG